MCLLAAPRDDCRVCIFFSPGTISMLSEGGLFLAGVVCGALAGYVFGYLGGLTDVNKERRLLRALVSRDPLRELRRIVKEDRARVVVEQL